MKTYVVKLGGAVCLQKDTLDALASSLKRLIADGHRVVVVHGGGPQIDKAVAALGRPVVKHKGLRRTSVEMMDIVKRELDKIGALLAAALWDRGVPTVHVGSTNRVLAANKKRLPDGFDLERVGTFEGTHVDDLIQDDESLEVDKRVPIVTPVGFDAEGPLNINADEAAAAIAAGLHAERLLLATDVDAVRGPSDEALRRIDEATAAALILEGVAEGGMVPKLMAALSALEAGVGSVVVGRFDNNGHAVLGQETPSTGTVITVKGDGTRIFHSPDSALAEATH